MKPMHPIRGRAAAIAIMALAAASAAFAMKVSSNQPAAADPLAGLTVAPEFRCTPYRRGDYPYPQTIEARIVVAQGGHVYGPYTGRTFPSTRHTDIDHIVSLSEAHDSGLCAADPATRRRFTTDLLNLTLAAPAVNRLRAGGQMRARRGRLAAADEPLLVRRPRRRGQTQIRPHRRPPRGRRAHRRSCPLR